MELVGGFLKRQFGQYLKQQRQKQRLSIRELSKRSGISSAYLSQIENAKVGIPSREVLEKLYYHLNVSYEDLSKQAGYYNEEEPEITYISEVTIDDVDLMTESEFKELSINLFRKMGFHLDQINNEVGGDMIVNTEKGMIIIQLHRYTSTVKYNSFLSLLSLIKKHRGTKGIIVSNGYYHDVITDLALAHNIILWDRNILKEKLETYF